ncbi:MAG: hypothetical protein K6C34_04640 [Alphaproteobacteria bacterium]|nr:hypothetical protein [Alphaproteobacteria bacterium]
MKKILLSSVMIAAMSVFIQDGSCGLRDWFRSKIHKPQVESTETYSKEANSRSHATNDRSTTHFPKNISPQDVLKGIKSFFHLINQKGNLSKQPYIAGKLLSKLNEALRKTPNLINNPDTLADVQGFLRSNAQGNKPSNSEAEKLLEKLGNDETGIEISSQRETPPPTPPQQINKHASTSAVTESADVYELPVSDTEEGKTQESEEETPPPTPPRDRVPNVTEDEEETPPPPPLPRDRNTVRTNSSDSAEDENVADLTKEEESNLSASVAPVAPSAPIAPVAPPPPAPPAPAAPVVSPAPAAPQAVQQQRPGGITAADIRNVKLKKSDNSTTKDAPATPTSRDNLLKEIQGSSVANLRHVDKSPSSRPRSASTGSLTSPETPNQASLARSLSDSVLLRRAAMREDDDNEQDDDDEWD